MPAYNQMPISLFGFNPFNILPHDKAYCFQNVYQIHIVKIYSSKNPKNSQPPKTFRGTVSVSRLPKIFSFSICFLGLPLSKNPNKNPHQKLSIKKAFSHFPAILYIPHPIKKLKNKYPLLKILKKWTTWTTRLIIREICATKCTTMRYILPKWTTFVRQKL